MVILRFDTLIGGIKHGERVAIPDDQTDVVLPALARSPWVQPDLGPPKVAALDWCEHRYVRVRCVGPKGSHSVIEFFADAKLDPDLACAQMWDVIAGQVARPKT